MDFYDWFTTFLEEKGLDMSEYLREDVQVGDICQLIVESPSSEQVQIKRMIIKIDFCNGSVNDYLLHLSNHVSEEKIKEVKVRNSFI